MTSVAAAAPAAPAIASPGSGPAATPADGVFAALLADLGEGSALALPSAGTPETTAQLPDPEEVAAALLAAGLLPVAVPAVAVEQVDSPVEVPVASPVEVAVEAAVGQPAGQPAAAPVDAAVDLTAGSPATTDPATTGAATVDPATVPAADALPVPGGTAAVPPTAIAVPATGAAAEPTSTVRAPAAQRDPVAPEPGATPAPVDDAAATTSSEVAPEVVDADSEPAPPTVQDLRPAPLRASAPVVAPVVAPATVPTPPAQLLTVLAPVLQGPDGSYALTLQLMPEELGQVQVDLLLVDGRITVHLSSADADAQELLRSSLPDLRAALEAEGLSATEMTVGQGTADGRPGERPAHWPEPVRRHEVALPTGGTAVPTTTPTTTARPGLDLKL